MDEKILIETARKKGLSNREHMEKDYFQDFVLYHIFKKTNKLVFKGGTALYKIYKLPRFSEDLDFTVAGDFDAEKAIQEIAGAMKASVAARKTADSLLFRLGFRGVLTKYNTLRIDISTKNRVLQGFDVANYVPEYVDIPPFAMRVLKPEEMAAEKIHSLLSRRKARDLYDLFFLLRLSTFNRKLAEDKLSLFNMRFSGRKFSDAVKSVKSLWMPELKPFVLSGPPEYSIVKKFVIERVCSGDG